MKEKSTILFVCEHGAAKSVIAAAHFNKLAGERGLNLRGIARGTDPEPEFSTKTLAGLSEDGLAPSEPAPQKLSDSDVESARQIIAFCELPMEYQIEIPVEHWGNVPPVSENYVSARDVILQRVAQLVDQIQSSK